MLRQQAKELEKAEKEAKAKEKARLQKERQVSCRAYLRAC